MHWPWTPKTEYRQDASFSEAVVNQILQAAGVQPAASAGATGALESAAGLIGRAFMTAEVQTASSAVLAALTPACLSLAGRTLIKAGEMIFLIETTGGRLALLPASYVDLDGGPDPDTWRYRCTVAGPSTTISYDDVPATSIVHLTYAVDPVRPWRGIGPIQAASLAGRLSAETTRVLAEESSGKVGRLLGIPVDGSDPSVAKLRADLKAMAGQTALLETGDWNSAGGGMVNLETKRTGPEPPQGLVNLLIEARADVLSACGVSPVLITGGQGVAMREAYRQMLFSTVAPLGKLVAGELSAKLNTPIILDWAELRASDIAGRARAFGTMVGGGMDLDRAAALSGLLSAVND